MPLKTLPITVLFFEGPIARAYLSALKEQGYIFQEAIFLIWKRRDSQSKPTGWFLPKSLRQRYTRVVQETSALYWPRFIKTKHPRFFNTFLHQIEKSLGQGSPKMVEEILNRNFILSDYAQEISYLMVENLKDPELEKALGRSPLNYVLFTGGGMVPNNLLTLPQKKFIHVHPGHLPEIRGADGLLWSMMVRGRPGASVFFMAPEIDEGDILRTEEFPAPSMLLEQDLDDQTLYRALFAFLDPLIRAQTLVRFLHSSTTDLDSAPIKKQDLSQGNTYHFLHTELRHRALRTLFRES